MKPTPEYCDMLKKVLRNCTAEGALCVGLVSGIAFRKNTIPTRAVLEMAAECKTIQEAIEIYQHSTKLLEVQPSPEGRKPRP